MKLNVTLLSYPRSGNTWLRYCAEFLTGHPTKGHVNKLDNDIKELNFRNNENPILIKTHYPKQAITNPNGLLMIVRDYKEVLIRHAGKQRNENNNVKFLESQTNGSTSIDYMKGLEIYDSYAGDKLMIYYEDLLEDTENTLMKVIDFLKCEKKDKLKEFIENIEEHKKKSIEMYDKRETSVTFGKTLNHHSSRIKEGDKVNWDNNLKTRFPELYEKYLKRYQEVESKV